MGRLLGLAQLRSRWGGRYLVVGLRRRAHYRCARGTRRRSPRIRTLTGDLGGERPRVGGGRKLDSARVEVGEDEWTNLVRRLTGSWVLSARVMRPIGGIPGGDHPGYDHPGST